MNNNMLDEILSTPFDWDQFLVSDPDRKVEAAAIGGDDTPASAILTLPSQANSPASATSTPKSTESEQSHTLEPSKVPGLFDFDFELPAVSGIVHDPSDILASLRASAPPSSSGATMDTHLIGDPTVMSTFGSTWSDWGNLSSLGSDAISQLQLGNLLSQLTAATPASTAPAPTPAPAAPSGLSQAYSALGWPTTKTEPETPAPAATAPSPQKRKLSEQSDDSAAAKRPRGRPPSATPIAKRPYRRQSKNGLSLSQLAAAATSGSPVVVPDDQGPESPSDGTIATGKASTARPKAVVPEKYMKNGEAQAITGMTTEQILSFPNWAALMACVDEPHRAGAEVFGKMISENRDKAKWAAKKSRDERKAKVESLEGQVEDLQGKIAEMRGLLLGLVGRGLVPLTDVQGYI